MSLYETLYPYQKNIIDKFKDRERYGLFLDCGLGKTLVSLAFTEVNECTKVIVITINAKAEETIDVGGSWMWWGNRSDIKYNFYNKKILKPTKKNPNNFSKDTNDFLLINYESLYNRNTRTVSLRPEIQEFLKACKGHKTAVILDESHKVKTSNSLTTKAVNVLVNFAKLYSAKLYLYLGTGTIFTRGLEDTYTQIKLLGWEGNKGVFMDSFCIRGRIGGLADWQQPIVGYKNVPQLYELIHRFGITIKSDDVVELPERINVYHTLPESTEFKLLTRDKIKMELVNIELKKRGLAEILSNDIYKKMSIETKTEYLKKINATVENDRVMFAGVFDIGSINDSYTDIIDFYADVYDNIDDFKEYLFVQDLYYLYKTKHDENDKVYHVAREYKASRAINNPFYRNYTFPETLWDAETKGALWMRARQMSIGFQGNKDSYAVYNYDRFKKLKELLEEHEDNYLLFYNYTPELYEIYKICEELGYNIDVFSGEKKSLENYNRYANQNEAERLWNHKNIIIANFVSGSTGLNWQLYNKCIIFSTPVFKDYEQGIKRIHRLGQKETCVYHIFSQANWLDEQMDEALMQNGDYNNDMFLADLKRVNELLDTDEED